MFESMILAWRVIQLASSLTMSITFSNRLLPILIYAYGPLRKEGGRLL